jgi:MFS family permease
VSFKHGHVRALSYFALLGVAYLFVEIAFIQKMILGLENPSSAASTVIASVLIGSGIGSALGGRIRSMRSPRILLVLAGTVLLYSLLLPDIIAVMSPQPLMMKTILSFIIVMPAGVLMGIPFPLGISVIGSTAPHLVPWAWAVNGCFSVIAPILAIILALSTGYQFVLQCGATAYMAAFWLIRHGRDADRKSKQNLL